MWSVDIFSLAVLFGCFFNSFVVGQFGDENLTWQKITSDDASAGDRFGYSVSMSPNNNIAIIGSPYNDEIANNGGAAYVFELDASSSNNDFVFTFKIVSDSITSTSLFGSSICIDRSGINDRVIIGAPQDSTNGNYRGSAYIFEKNTDGETDDWIEVSQLFADSSNGASNGDRFGTSVSLYNNIAVIGSPYDGTSNTGAAYVYKLDSDNNNEWTFVTKLIASDAGSGDLFGYSVSIFDTSIIVGAYEKSNGGNNVGGVYIFTQGTDDSDWSESVNMESGSNFNGDSGDRVGISVSLHSDNYVAGAVWDDDVSNNCGAVQLWETIDNLNNELLTPATSYTTKGIGNSVDINNKLIISGSRQNLYVFDGIVEVWIYDEINDIWENSIELLPSDDDVTNNYYGWSVSAGCDCIITSSYEDDTNGNNAGAAYIVCGFDSNFDTCNEGNTPQPSTIPTSSPFSVCDEFIDDTSKFYRWYNSENVDNFYTTDSNGENEGSNGYILQGYEGYLWKNEYSDVTVPLYRWYNSNKMNNFYTTDSNGEIAPSLGYDYIGIAGYIMTQYCNEYNEPLYRYYNSKKVDHLYTTDYNEIGDGNNDYTLEGVAGYVAIY